MRAKRTQRERGKGIPPEYEVVIPTREEILHALDAVGAPCTFKALAKRLQVDEKAARTALQRRLLAMVRDGQLIVTRDDRFGVASAMELQPGRVIGHPDGFAFVRPEKGDEDIYLAPREARKVLHGDRVLVRIAGQDARGRPFGAVIEVLERANQEVVGRFMIEGGIGLVSPDNKHLNQDVLVPAGAELGARPGQIVLVKLDSQPDARHQPLGHVIEVLGDHLAPGMEIDVAIRSHGIPVRWPNGLEGELAQVPTAVRAADMDDRRDLRELPFVTIDGQDARDFDDAIYCRRTRDGYVLYVAIADVAHYVRPRTTLDVAARERGTSVYFPARVIPMLPEVLSNGICSLNPAVDRLALVCELRYDANGERTRARFFNAVIRSHARLTYDAVAPRLGLQEAESEEDRMLQAAYALYGCLRTQREARGALDIDTVEPLFVFDDARKIARIEARTRNDAHRLIEEFMIAANIAAAEFLLRHKRPTLFRVHAVPDAQKIESLRLFLQEIGLALGGGEIPSAQDFARVLAASKQRPDRALLETVLLRSLKLAVYTPDNIGHFGLSLPAYLHFTSPIRRYPDLLAHRAIKDVLARGKGPPEDYAALGEHCSMTERRADDATRDAVAWLKCEYMQDKVGETFSGLISGVTAFGLFVQLEKSFVEGLLHVSALPEDYYHFDPVHHRMVGRRSNQEYRLGQTIAVTVARVSLDERKIDFLLAQEIPQKSKRKRR